MNLYGKSVSSGSATRVVRNYNTDCVMQLQARPKKGYRCSLWLKTKASATRQELSQRLGRNESTVYRWLNRYQQQGIEALLYVKTPPGKQSLVPQSVLDQLHQKLIQPEGFNSYSQIQEWRVSRVPSCSGIQNCT